MMGFGFIFMLLLIALPILGIVALAIWLINTNRQRNAFGVNPSSEIREQTNGPELKGLCSHCGAGLQDGWTHCPQCGAGIGS